MRLYTTLFCDSFLYEVITHKMLYITVFTYCFIMTCTLYTVQYTYMYHVYIEYIIIIILVNITKQRITDLFSG